MLSATWHRRVLEHRHLVALVAAYLLIVGIVLPPTGEYPTYDDGVFAATARDFAERGAMRISDLPSMTLVTHAAWGAGWMLLLGDSWWTLRVATMVMAWIGGLALYALCREFDRTPAEAAAACGSYIFCPLVFALNYTFMTDLTGTSLMLVGLACLPGCLRSGTVWSLASLGLIGGAAYLARQTAAIPTIMLGGILLVQIVLRRRRWQDLAAFGLPLLFMVGCYTYWLREVNGVPSVFGSVTLKLEILTQLKGSVSKGLGLALEAALLMAPLLISVAYRIDWRKSIVARRRWQACVLAVSFLLFVLAFAPELKPYRGYELFDAGLGFPPTHEGLYQALRSPEIVRGMTLFHVCLLVPATVLLMLLAGIVVVISAARLRSWSTESLLPGEPHAIARTVAILSLVGYCGLLMLIEFVFDRYVIPLVVFWLVALVQLPRAGSPSPGRDVWTWVTLCVMIGCNVVGTQDAIQVRRAYWDTVKRLHEAGIAPDDLDAGSTYWQTDVYEPAVRKRTPPGPTFLAGLSPEPWNGIDSGQATWKVAFGEAAGWDVRERVPFKSWVRTGEILVMRRTTETR